MYLCIGNFHLTQLERHTQRHCFHDQRTLFQLMSSNGLVALVISGEKTVEKLFHFLFFLQECVGYTFTMSTSYWFLRDKLFIGESMISCLEKRKAMR